MDHYILIRHKSVLLHRVKYHTRLFWFRLGSSSMDHNLTACVTLCVRTPRLSPGLLRPAKGCGSWKVSQGEFPSKGGKLPEAERLTGLARRGILHWVEQGCESKGKRPRAPRDMGVSLWPEARMQSSSPGLQRTPHQPPGPWAHRRGEEDHSPGWQLTPSWP